MAIDRIRVNEGSSKTVSFTLKDQAGDAVPLTSLAAAALTLYDVDSYQSGSPAVGIINLRNGQDILNHNDVTIHTTSGLVTWAMQADDNAITTARRQIERHRAQFEFTLIGGVTLQQECEIEVVNLRTVA